MLWSVCMYLYIATCTKSVSAAILHAPVLLAHVRKCSTCDCSNIRLVLCVCGVYMYMWVVDGLHGQVGAAQNVFSPHSLISRLGMWTIWVHMWPRSLLKYHFCICVYICMVVKIYLSYSCLSLFFLVVYTTWLFLYQWFTLCPCWLAQLSWLCESMCSEYVY